jgi:hypothetical protein
MPAYDRVILETIIIENKHFIKQKDCYPIQIFQQCVKPFLSMSYEVAIRCKSIAMLNLLSEGAALAIYEVQYPLLGNILRLAYD